MTAVFAALVSTICAIGSIVCAVIAVRARRRTDQLCNQLRDLIAESANQIQQAAQLRDQTVEAAKQIVQAAELRAFGASHVACFRWPADTPEHRALRAAYIDGAAACGGSL